MPDHRAGSRTSGICPYDACSSMNLVTSPDGTEPRRPDHTLMQCLTCMGYCVRTRSGMVFPLVDAENPDADPAVCTVDR